MGGVSAVSLGRTWPAAGRSSLPPLGAPRAEPGHAAPWRAAGAAGVEPGLRLAQGRLNLPNSIAPRGRRLGACGVPC